MREGGVGVSQPNAVRRRVSPDRHALSANDHREREELFRRDGRSRPERHHVLAKRTFGAEKGQGPVGHRRGTLKRLGGGLRRRLRGGGSRLATGTPSSNPVSVVIVGRTLLWLLHPIVRRRYRVVIIVETTRRQSNRAVERISLCR